MKLLFGQSAALILALTACSDSSPREALDEGVENLIEWSRLNSPVSSSTWAGVDSWTCRPSTAQICEAGGCEKQAPKVWLRWKPKANSIERCGADGCDAYTPTISYSGSWANLSIPDRGMMVRMTASGQYLEILTQMDTVLIYRGLCRAP